MTHPRIGKHLAPIAEQLRYSTDPGNDGQKVGIAGPPRDDVLMQVRGNPGTTGCPLIDAYVEPLWTGHLLEGPDGILGELGHLDDFVLGCIDVPSNVAVRAYQHVPRSVGIKVHDDVAVLATVDDKGVLVATLRGSTEGTTILRPVTSRLIFTRDIRHPIRGPEPLKGSGTPTRSSANSRR